MTPYDLLAAYDLRVRATFAARVPRDWVASQDGPLTRCLTPRGGFAMAATSLEELSAGELGGLIDRTVAFYERHGQRFEWKTFDHDRDGFTGELRSRGFVPEEHEALVLGPVQGLATDPVLPAGLTLREVRERADFERIAAMESEVWAEDWGWLADDLAGRVDDPNEPTVVYVVEDGDRVVSAAWLVAITGTPFAGLWGGSTLPTYRGRGVYRALVACRAQEAQRRGFTMLQVDASDDSRPILERLGLQVVGGTTPYIWTPARA
ncbi:MAG: GNAT family N-acetyltransferase [Marmoricola sp.]